MKIVINCETNDVLERELNKKEKDQEKLDNLNAESDKQAEELEMATKATARAELLAKLGITAEEAALLLG